MDKIKEKPHTVASVREDKGCAEGTGPSRPGGWIGTDCGRSSGRRPAGGRYDYGGDQMEDAAAGGAPHGARRGKAHQGETESRPRGGSPRRSRSRGSRAGGSYTGGRKAVSTPRRQAGRRKPAGNAGQRIKTKDTYLRAQPLTPASGLTPERTQGQHPFIRGARTAGGAEVRASQSRADGTRQAVGRSLLSLWRSPASGRTALGNGGRQGDRIAHAATAELAQDTGPLPKGNAERLP